MILVEDFHWADPSTVEIVERIADQIGNAPILLVITSRAKAIRSGSLVTRRILLQRLDDDDCRDLAGSVIRDKHLPSQLIEQIVARSDGVPLFVEELTAAALETGQVDPGASIRMVPGGPPVPSALYDSLMLRLERLGEAKAIAQLASVIGRSFPHQLLAAVASEHGNDTPEPALEQAARVRVDQARAQTTTKRSILQACAGAGRRLLFAPQTAAAGAARPRRRRDRTPPAGNCQ